MRRVGIGLVAVAGIFAQAPPQFRETAVIPSFRKVDARVAQFQTIHRQALDGAYTLLVVGARAPRPGWGPGERFYWMPGDLVGVFLMETANPDRVWEIEILGSGFDGEAKVERADSRSIVLSRSGNYGIPMDSIKLLFDAGTNRLIRRVLYPPIAVRQMVTRGEELYFLLTAGEKRLVARQDQGGPRVVTGREAERVLDEAPANENSAGGPAPLPQSSYDEFARARPARVENGYVRKATTIEEWIGPSQIVGDRFWFAKTFYDGEGMSGVGAVGYFDPVQRKYIMHSPPELADWSASALLVEPEAVWIGLVRHPEGAPFGGGLLRYRPESGRAEKHKLEEIIFEIRRWRDGLYLGTANGVFILREGRFSRYVFEPGVDGETEVVAVGR